MKLSLLAALAVTSLPLYAQTPKLEAKSLEALKEKPAVTAPKFVPKSTGPVVEKKRAYTFTAKGTASKAARVITMTDGTKTECPLVEIPLRFLKDSTQLADPQSKANLAVLADHLKANGDGGKFCIEGHASAEGDGTHNQTLSEQRAQAIRDELIANGVAPTVLAPPVGRGALDATVSAKASEQELAQDRRVLVVREQ
jgi:outer membrane protein OmpA-like peptidoglycan-associated protein